MKVNGKLIPVLLTPLLRFDFWFVDRLILTWAKKFPNNKEHGARFLCYEALELDHSCLGASIPLLFLSCNVESSVVLPRRVVNLRSVSLVDSCDNLMHLELNRAYVLLCFQIVLIILIIHIIGLDQELLVFFEVVINFKLSHEVWVKVIINAFSPS